MLVMFLVLCILTWTEVQPLTTSNILFAASSSTVGLIFQYCAFISRSLDYEAFYLGTNTQKRKLGYNVTGTTNHQQVGPILMEETHRGNSVQLHSVQIKQELQVIFQELATKDRIQDLAVSNTLDTVSKNLAHSRAYRLDCSMFLISRRSYSLAGKIWVAGPMHSGPVFEIYVTFSLLVLLNRIPQTTLRSHSRLP